MLLQQLPKDVFLANQRQPPVFTDHCLFTETINTGYEYPEHTSALGLLAVYRGEGRYTLNGCRITTTPHVFAVVNRGSRLSVRFSAATQPSLLYFDTRTAASVQQAVMLSHGQLLEAAPSGMPDLAYLERVQAMDEGMRERLSLLPRLGNGCSSFAALKADGIVRSMLEDILRRSGAAASAAARLHVAKHSTRVEIYRRLALAREWIEANYSGPVALDDMAGAATMNSHHFLRMFSQCYGITPHRWLTGIRLQRSRELLQHCDVPVAEVAARVGFESASSFSWLFRQRFGMPPTAFRRQFRR